MDDLMSKIQEMLSDEESMNQIKQLAEMLGGATDDTGTTPSGGAMPDLSSLFSGGKSTAENPSGNSDSGGLGFDMGTLMQLQGLLKSVSSNDKNADLLYALKPHLREDKQAKVDKAVKLLKLFALWTVVKESGLLKSMDLF